MADKAINQYQTKTTLDNNVVFPVGTGTTTMKVSLNRLKESLSDGLVMSDQGKYNAGKMFVVDNDGIARLRSATELGTTIIPLTVSKNGVYTAPLRTAYSPVTVNVSGGDDIAPNDVTFYDYDGRIVASYSASDFANLSAMPDNPEHEGLVAQGWNWTLADAKAYVRKYGMLNIGQMYDTVDGKCHFHICIEPNTPNNRMTFYLRWTQSVSDGVRVDWGDGYSETFSETGANNHAHRYASSGDYDITLSVEDGNIAFSGNGNSSIFGELKPENHYNRFRIKAVKLSTDVVSIGGESFELCDSLTTISIPNSVTSIGHNAFLQCNHLTGIIVPYSCINLGGDLIYASPSIKSIVLPRNIISEFGLTALGCNSLTSLTLPETMTMISENAFIDANFLARIVIPDSVTSIGESAFMNCFGLTSIVIPNSVSEIGDEAFYNTGLGEIHFRNIVPATIATNRVFLTLSTDCIIYVPTGSLAAYQSAANYPDPEIYTYIEE